MARRTDPARGPEPHTRPEDAGRSAVYRGRGARVPGWHADEVREALRHFAGAKEELRAVADLLRAASPEPAVAEQRHLELLAAALFDKVQGDAFDLARAIAHVRHAAAIASNATVGADVVPLRKVAPPNAPPALEERGA